MTEPLNGSLKTPEDDGQTGHESVSQTYQPDGYGYHLLFSAGLLKLVS